MEDVEESDGMIDLEDTLVVINAEASPNSPPPLNSLVNDVLYRPCELESVCMWDQFGLYTKIRRKPKKHETRASAIDDPDIENPETVTDEDQGNSK
jgi:hypothetical protein